MATYDASIKKALASQEDLIAHREHCSVDPERLATIECTLGNQVRIKRNASEFGLFTVSDVRQEDPDSTVRMGLAGRRRLGTSDEFDGVVDAQVPHPTLTEAEAEAENEFVERLEDDGEQQELIAIAPHGGAIEPHTDQQAERVASRLAAEAVSSWRCKGWNSEGDPFGTWHITSAKLSERSFPLLAKAMCRRFTHAVAFHGFDDPEILIGGLAPLALKQEIQRAIEGATAGSGIQVRIAGPEDVFGGDDPLNVVNRLTAGGANGLQIEQSFQARADHWRTIADAVADVYAPKLQLRPATLIG
jgi:phage replication-related protein YjqB (UPF0714/DUF867 family)